MVRRQRRDLVAPIVGVGEAAVQQHDRRAVADRRVVQADAVDLGVAGVFAGDRRRRGRQRLPQRIGHGDAQRDGEQQRQQHDAAHSSSPWGRLRQDRSLPYAGEM